MSNKDFPTISHYLTLNTRKDNRKITLLSSGYVRFQFLFDIKKFKTKLLIVIAVSIFIGVYNFFILERTGLYSLGINSVFQSIARCVSYFLKKSNYTSLASVLHVSIFWGMSLFLNIPLAIICFKKIGRIFSILTITMIVFSSLTSLTLSSLPDSWGLKNFYIFSDPRTYQECITKDGINILQWNSVVTTPTSGDSSGTSSPVYLLSDTSKLSLIFLYGFLFGLLNTFTSMIIYAVGGSTGGVDWIVFYITKNKQKAMSNIYLYISLIITFFAYAIGTYIPYVNHLMNDAGKCKMSVSNQVISNLFGPILIATTIAVFTKKILFSLFYPHFKFVSVKIFTTKANELRNMLIESGFPHSFTINTATGGYMLKKQPVFEIICFALDLKIIKSYVNKVDPGCLIVASPINSVNGRFIVNDHLK